MHPGYEYSLLLEYSFASIIHGLALLSRFSKLLLRLTVGKYYEAVPKGTVIRFPTYSKAKQHVYVCTYEEREVYSRRDEKYLVRKYLAYLFL